MQQRPKAARGFRRCVESRKLGSSRKESDRRVAGGGGEGRLAIHLATLDGNLGAVQENQKDRPSEGGLPINANQLPGYKYFE